MSKVKTQTFKLGKYEITEIDTQILGLCDTPSEKLGMMIPSGNTQEALWVTLHEASHAEGVLDKYLHGDRDFTVHQAKLLWRLGWRRSE